MPYGLHPRAVQALRDGATLAIAEGPLDAEAINVASRGRIVAIAPLGTALTAGQLTTINQLAPLTARPVLVATDTDTAGRAAAAHAHTLLTAAGVTDAHAITLPGDAEDPAQVVARNGGAEQLVRALDQQRHPLADIAVDQVLTRWPDRSIPEYAVGALHKVAPLIARLPPQQRERQVDRVAEQLGMELGTVAEVVMQHLPAPPPVPLDLPAAPQLSTVGTAAARQLDAAPAAAPAAAAPTTPVSRQELGRRAKQARQQLAELRQRQQHLSAVVVRLSNTEPGAAEAQLQREILRSAQFHRRPQRHRRRRSTLRQEWMARGRDMAAAEQRIQNGGRRAQRRGPARAGPAAGAARSGHNAGGGGTPAGHRVGGDHRIAADAGTCPARRAANPGARAAAARQGPSRRRARVADWPGGTAADR